MRSSMRARRAYRHSHLQIEQLEPRQLLSISLAGTMLSSYQTFGGTAQFSVTNSANLTTQITVNFERDIDSTQAAPIDHLQLSVKFGNSSGQLGTVSPGTNYTVASTSTGLRLTGQFDLDGTAFGVTFEHATLSLDVTWTRVAVTQHVDSVELDVATGLRDLTVSTQDACTANATGSFAWTSASVAVQNTFPTSPLSLNAGTAGVVSSYRQTNDLPESLSLKTLIQELSPPDSAPKNSKVSVHSTQAATTGLVITNGDPNSGIRVSQGQDYFTNPQVFASSAFLAFSGPSGDFFGFCTTGTSVSADGSSADAKGGADGTLIDSFGNFITIPFNLDLHWEADPSSALLTFIRTTTTTPTTITTEYAQQSDYDALVTGTASFNNMGGTAPTFAANGALTQFRSVTISTPLPVKGHVVSLPDATVISKSDWQNIVVTPWTNAISIADDGGFLGGKGKGKNLVVTLRRALRFQYACMNHSRGLN